MILRKINWQIASFYKAHTVIYKRSKIMPAYNSILINKFNKNVNELILKITLII